MGLAMAVSAAQPLPEWIPQSFQEQGVLNAYHTDRGMVVVNDMVFPLSENVVVGSVTTPQTRLSALEKGQPLGLVIPGYPASKVVTEVWILARTGNTASDGKVEPLTVIKEDQ
jgi:hypothetical protein